MTGSWASEAFDALMPGTYVLEVLDGDSTCGAVEVFTIDAAPDPGLFLVASAPECAGGEDGNISAFVADTVTVTGYTRMASRRTSVATSSNCPQVNTPWK